MNNQNNSNPNHFHDSDAAPHDQAESAIVSLPSHPEGERHILASLLGHGRIVAESVAPLLCVEDFHFANNRVIFAAIYQAFAEGSDILPHTVAEVLDRSSGGLRAIGGVERLEQLSINPPGVRGASPAAKLLAKYRVKRELVWAAQRVALLASDLSQDHDAMLSQCVALVQNAAMNGQNSLRTESIVSVGARVRAQIADRAKNGSDIIGAPTGLRTWDLQVSGIIPKKLNLVVGATGMGKTAALLTMCKGVASSGSPCLIFSLEMDNDALYYRYLSMLTGIDSRRIAVGGLSDAEWDSVDAAIQTLDRYQVEMNDWAGMTVRDIEATTRDFVSRRHGSRPATMFIDYAQIIANADKRGDSTEALKIQNNIYALRELAKNMGLGLVVLAQLNRDVDKREDHRPRLSDIADSAGLAKAADTITALYRPAYYASLRAAEEGLPEAEGAISEARLCEAPPDEAEWIVMKGRDGGTRALKMTFHPTRTMFTCGGLDMRGF